MVIALSWFFLGGAIITELQQLEECEILNDLQICLLEKCGYI
jgi:hypothetical protein